MAAIRPLHHRPVSLRALASEIGLHADTEGEVSGIVLDSRAVRPGCLYVALPGSSAHGASFTADAVRSGALAVLTDHRGAQVIEDSGGTEVPILVADDVRTSMARAAAVVFDRPAERLMTFAVTGTNGKTTTVALLEAALAMSGIRVGTVGTIGFRLDGVAIPSRRSTVTTPEAPDLQALLAVMAERGADAVALEVSSHALKLERTAGMVFDVAAFLNLGRDHLDFHPDLEDYFESKAKLVSPEYCRQAVIWIDDEHGAQLARRGAGELPIVTVGTSEEADYVLSGFESVAPLGGRALVERRGETLEIEIALPGWHNMIDAAVAFAMLETQAIPVDAALAGLAQAQVPGRMQLIDLGGPGPVVIVDFAHTPQAVAATLEALQGFDHVISVLGCGGDRDAEKRPLMGAAAAERSDLLVITDDNPRTESPAAIRAAMLAGAQGTRAEYGRKGVCEEVGGRGEAIRTALKAAHRGSVVAILGKGHETGQEVDGVITPFDDAVEARRVWDTMREGHGA